MLDKLDVGVELAEVIILGINELGVNVVDEARAQDGNKVTGEHDRVATKGGDGDGTALDLGTDHPAGKSEDKSRPGGDDGTSTRGLVPGHQVPEGNDGGSDHDTHEEVDPTKVETNLGKKDGEGTHEETEDNNDDTGNLEDLLTGSIGVEVLTVDIVGNERRDGNGLGGTGGDDGHEKHDKDKDGTSVAKEVVGDGGGDKAGSSLTGGDGEHEGGGGKTEGGGEGEGDGEPADTTEEVSLGGGRGAGGDSGLPVGLIDEDGTEVTNDVDDTEHETISGKHGEVGSGVVVGNGTAGILVGVEEGGLGTGVIEGVGRVDLLALLGGVRNGPVEEGVDLIGRVRLDVDNHDHGHEDGEDDDSVEVTGDEGSLETAGTGVENDTPGDQEGRKTVIDTGEGLDGSSATEQKHRGNDNVGAEGEEEEGQVGGLSPTGADDLTDGMGRRSDLLERDGEDAEEKNLDGGARGIPVRGGGEMTSG